jgi:hypothetical protein
MGVIKTACFSGIYGFFLGVIFLLYLMILSLVLSVSLSDMSTGIFPSFFDGILGILLIPILYGVILFLIGLVFTPLMNLILKMINGLDWDIEIEQQTPVVVPSQNLEYSQGPPRQY